MLLLKLPRLHPDTWSRDILCDPQFTQSDRELITTAMHSIWVPRNNVTQGEVGFNPTKTMEYVRDTLQALELPKVKNKTSPIRLACRWQKPSAGFVKLNSDGAMRIEDEVAAPGTVARDDTSFRGAAAKVYKVISDPLIIEALALRDAFVYLVERNFQRVVFDVDSTLLVQHWNNRTSDRSVIKSILEEISEIGSSLSSFSVVSVRREANEAAHCCAKYASIQLALFSWDVEPPDFLDHSLQTDCNLVVNG